MNYKHFSRLVGWLVTCVYALALLASQSAGQGFKASDNKVVGTSDATAKLQQLYSSSRNWQRNYRLNPSAACSSTRRGSLCAAADSSDLDSYAQQMLATSPQSYSSLDSRYTGGLKLVAAPKNQRPCNTCSAFAVASAAETAMASALGANVSQCSISVQALHFCPPGNQASRGCSGGYTLSSTLELLRQYHGQLPTDDCLSYKPSLAGDPKRAGYCAGRCTSPSQYANQGSFGSIQLTTAWEAQMYIRKYGSVVTQFDIMDDFKPFFKNPANAKAVYKPKSGARLLESHAVVLVGYDNDKQFWLAKNSWGSDWADGGFFRVAYDTCSILTRTGEAYGLTWQPVALQLPLSPGPRAGCFWYKAGAGDYMSKVAWVAGVPLDKFMLDNVGNVKDLDASLQGKQLLVCNPAQGSSALPGSSSSNTPSSTSTPGSSGDPQLEALLRIKAAVDTTNFLKEWTRESGANGGYCRSWRGVGCDKGQVKTVTLNYTTIGSGLRGTLPSAAAFSGLTGCIYPFIGDQSGITGTIPSDWSRLVQLEEVNLGNNSLTGTIPAAWGSLTRLRSLWLFFNNLTGQLPDSFKELKALQDLSLASNQLTGPIPTAWGSLTRLKELYLWGNKLTGQLPDSFKGLRSLESLDVGTNKLSGTIPAWLGTTLGRLNRLTLYANAFSGSIPTSLGNLKQLKMLELGANKLTGQLPDSFKELKLLEELSLILNTLTGSIPATWGGLSGVKGLYIRGNKLTGQLPDSFKELRSLEQLDASTNKLSGTIPAWLGTNWGRLNVLNLRDNAFSGTIPPSLGNLKQLTLMGLGGNKLMGPLPDSFSNLKALKELGLDESPYLTGTIPASWASMTALTKVSLQFVPQLQGCFPAAWRDRGTAVYTFGTKIVESC